MDIAEPFIEIKDKKLWLVIVKDFYELKEIRNLIKGNIKTVQKMEDSKTEREFKSIGYLLDVKS